MNLDPALRDVAAEGCYVGDKRVTGITLSRTNLETLLAKLDTPGSRATIMRQCSDASFEFAAHVVVVKAEEDADHYHNRARQAEAQGVRGVMREDNTDAHLIPVPGHGGL